MKVYDCFTFYNEFELLELRLKSLWDMVDYFVLVEADRNHANEPKPFYFGERIAEFKEFLPKLRHIPLRFNLEYKGVGDWTLENAQRNGIMYGLTDAEPDDLIFISDVDEFPAPDIIKRINENNVQLISQCPITPPLADGRMLTVPCQILAPAMALLEYFPIALNQIWHYYYFDWATKVQMPTELIVKRKNLTTPHGIRKLREIVPRIQNGGWHFSYMGGVDRIIKKMTSIVEGYEFTQKNKKLTDRDYVKECMRTGKDIYGRKNIPEAQFYPYDISNITLSYLNEFLEKYPYFLREYDFGKDDV